MSVWDAPESLRLVVLDVETCVGPDKQHRVLSVGVAVARGVGVMERLEVYANPGCDIDPITQDKHHITNAHVKAEPPLNEVWPEIARHFTGRPGETVVLAAHYSAFDIPVLRNELARTGGTPLPDLPVLDTAGALCSLAGLKSTKRGLKWILLELGITNPFPHNALSDATATAEAARVLVDRAMERQSDLAALLAAAGASTPAAIAPSGPREVRERKARVFRARLPDDHIAAHATATDADFPKVAAACAAQRCPSLADTARRLPGPASRKALFSLLEDRAKAGDGAGTATVLGALVPLLVSMPRSVPAARKECRHLRQAGGAVNARGVALAVAVWLEATLTPIARCPEDDPCPDCAEARPCPLDTWAEGLVPLAIDGTPAAAYAFWDPASGNPAEQGWSVMRSHSQLLADRVLRSCLPLWEAASLGELPKVAEQVWAAGGRDPRLTETRIALMVRAGRRGDLEVALADADPVVARNRGSTDPAALSLAVRVAQVRGRLERLAAPGSRHARLAQAKRPPRPTRFLRELVLAAGDPPGD